MKNQSPLISVIVPVHNPGLYLNECIDSILTQSYQNIEVIFVNDDSTDSSESVIQKYRQRDGRIQYYKTNNHNAALTRREGISHSSAELVCFIDSDDLVSDKYVETLHDSLTSNQTEISSVKMTTFIDGDDVSSRRSHDTGEVSVDKDLLAYFSKNYHWNFEGGHVPQSINAKLFYKKLFKETDYSILKTTILEDNYIVPQIFKRADPQIIASVDSTLYYYRHNPQSTMATALDKMITYGDTEVSYPELFETTMNYIKELYSNHPKVDEYINKIKIEEYYGIAESIVDKNIHMRTLVARVKEANRENDKLKRSLDIIYRSKSYMFSRALIHPIKAVKAILKRMTAIKFKA